jgi:hypothetical protein
MPQRITSQSSGLRECESHIRLLCRIRLAA